VENGTQQSGIFSTGNEVETSLKTTNKFYRICFSGLDSES